MNRYCLFLLFALLGLWQAPARADTSLGLFGSWAGNVNFVGTERTIRTKSNYASGNNPSCAITNASVSATLSGIPSTATILSAQLYWAGSGNTASSHYSITLDGVTVTALAARRYSSDTGDGTTYFSGAADVTSAVQAKRNGTYAFDGLSVSHGSPWCDYAAVLGGYALLVVYSDPGETFRVLNLYEGFQFMQWSGLTLNVSNFQIPSPLGSATGRIGHITWEGDPDLGTYEALEFNNYELYDSTNPSGNQFNSASNINDDTASYGIDFDAYTVGAPVIAAGQTSASTYYQSGQDLVLLSAEVVAVPNTPTSDLSVSLTRSSTLVSGQAGSYSVALANAGPSTESGPITVTSTFSSGVTITGASGTGFSCSVSGQVVTCTYSGSMASGSTAGPIAIGVTVTGASGSTVSNTTTVSGTNFDNVSGNNSATDSTTVTTIGGVFTDAVCTPGLALGNASQPCHLWTPTKFAGQASDFYFTKVNASGVPTAATSNTNLKFGFAFVCNNPTTTAGTAATVASQTGSTSVTLSSCSANAGGAPTSYSAGMSFTLANGAATSSNKFTFTYPDVGQVTLYAKDYLATKFYFSSPFIQRPYRLALTDINGGALSPTSTTTPTSAFVAAGSDFTLTAAAYAADGTTVTPNFGREITPQTFFLGATGATAGMSVPALTGSFAIANGVGTGTFQFSEVGVLNVTPQVNDQSNTYLGAGAPNSSQTSLIGRFIPHHFLTVLAGPMTCSTTTTPACTSPITTAAYAQQTLSTATITAVNAAGTTTSNYANSLGYAHAVNLVAASASNSAGSLASQPGGGTFAATGVTGQQVAASQFTGGVATLASAKYSFSSAYSRTAPTAGRIAPQSVYLVATDNTDSAATSVGATGYETGVTVLSGRLYVPNAYGSDRASVPLPLQLQYAANTSGTWSLNQIDSSSTVLPSTLQQSCVSGTCATMTVANASLTFSNGKAPTASPVLLAPVTTTGRFIVDLYFNNASWLPSTVGRVAVGTFKSPLIYSREVY